MDTFIASVKKTNRCVVVHEGWTKFGFGAEIAASITEQAFDWLDAPVARVGMADIPMPYNDTRERAAIPGTPRACDANGLAPVVRAPSNDPVFIGRALDAGASAVVVPGISTAAEAATAVAATRFAPDGIRGACPCVRAGGHYITDWRAYAGAQAQETGIIALVETREGLDNIETITAVEGLLALMVGPFDLSVSLGHGGDYLHPKNQAAIDRMLAAAHANRLPVIAPVFNPDAAEAKRQQQHWMDKGVRLFVVGTDKILFASAFRRYARALG
jgi:4-hydroxy-2-oxoheptanedioate aldolase